MEQHCHELQKFNSLMFIEGKAFWKDAIKKRHRKIKEQKIKYEQ